MFIVNPNEIDLHKKISAPLIQPELEYMKSFGMENGDGFISRKEYTMLIIIRIGRVKATVVEQIRKQFQDLLVYHGEKKLLSYEHLQRVSNKSLFWMSRILPIHSADSDELDDTHWKRVVEEESVTDEDKKEHETEIDTKNGMELPHKMILPETSNNDMNNNDAIVHSSKHKIAESKQIDKIEKSEQKDEEEEEHDEFPSHNMAIPQLGDIKNKKPTKIAKISNESYRNLQHSSSTKKHLQKIQKVSVCYHSALFLSLSTEV